MLDLELPRRVWIANWGQLTLVPGLRLFSKSFGAPRYQPLFYFILFYFWFVNLYAILGKFVAWAETGHVLGKSTGRVCCWECKLCCYVSGYQLGRQMVVANLMESLYLVPASTYRLCGGKAQQRNNGICQHFFPKRELPWTLPLQLLPWN